VFSEDEFRILHNIQNEEEYDDRILHNIQNEGEEEYDDRILHNIQTEEEEENEDFDGDEEEDFELYHDVYWLDSDKEETENLGEAIGQGAAVVCIPDVLSEDECRLLCNAGLKACAKNEKLSEAAIAAGRNRFSVSDPRAFSNDVVLSCDAMLLTILDYIDEHIPSIYQTLFKSTTGEDWLRQQPLNARLEQSTVPPSPHLSDVCEGLRDLYNMGELEWSEGEPAINVYDTNGYFGAHKDHLALTILIPLSSPDDDFTGGGTAFWKGNRDVDENLTPDKPPTTIIAPLSGSALLFGGDVTHAGMPVETGTRTVFVCSFSTRTPASPANRLHGLQAPPPWASEVSSGF